MSYDDWKTRTDRDEEEDLYDPHAKPENWCNTCEGRGWLLGSVGRPTPCYCLKGNKIALELMEENDRRRRGLAG